MAQQNLILKAKGLYTHPNDLSSVPDGALAVADNVVINREDVVEPRRGYDLLRHANTPSGFSAPGDRANKLFFFQDQVLAHYGSNKLGYHDSTTGWNALAGSYLAPTGAKIRSAQANQNLYLTTAAGVVKLDSYNTNPVKAGVPRGLDVQASLVNSTGFLAKDYRVAYRIVWGIKDANQNLILGAPSQSESIKNTSNGSRDISLVFTIPEGITTAHFYQVYRTAAVDNSTIYFEPSEEYGLVYESNPTSIDIANKYLSVTDVTPDELRGANLYTNVNSGEGIAYGNVEPPMAKDIATFRDTTFYVNTISKHRYYLNLLASGGTNGIALNDTLKAGGVTYTAKAVEDSANAQFRVFLPISFTFVPADVNTSTDVITKSAHGLQNGDPIVLSNAGGMLPTGLTASTTYYVRDVTANTFKLAASLGGTAIDITAAGSGTNTLEINRSPAQNIRETALSLVKVVNRYAPSTVVAMYLSSVEDLPGKILLEEESIGGASFAVTSNNATCWSPKLPSSGTSESSTNDMRKNGVSFSKPLQPEAVPLPHTRYVGSKDEEILRAIPLRDKLILFKTDGIYSISSYDFGVELLDSTSILLSPESAVVLNNQILCLTTQGVCAVSDTGVQVISRPIERTLIELLGLNPTVLKAQSFGVSSESDRKYILFVPSNAGDTVPTQAFIYDIFTNSWTRWTLSKTCGGVNPADDKIYLGSAVSNYVNIEKKSYNFTDFVDFGFTSSITNITSNVFAINQADQVKVGDILYSSSTVYSVIESVDTVGGTVTVANPVNFVVGSVDVLKAISTKVGWAPIAFGNPGLLKQFTEASLLLSQPFQGTARLVFTSDQSPSREFEFLQGVSVSRWGLFPWGGAAWGGSGTRKPLRVFVPQNKQRATILNVTFEHSTGYAIWSLNGLSIQANPGTSRVGR